MGRHDIRDPVTIEERRSVARRCEGAIRLGMPTCVDDMRDTAMKAYAAWPDRLYLVGRDGRIIKKVKGVYAEDELKRDVVQALKG